MDLIVLIDVYEAKKTNGVKQQTITVYYKLVGNLIAEKYKNPNRSNPFGFLSGGGAVVLIPEFQNRLKTE